MNQKMNSYDHSNQTRNNTPNYYNSQIQNSSVNRNYDLNRDSSHASGLGLNQGYSKKMYEENREQIRIRKFNINFFKDELSLNLTLKNVI